jgi:acetolactate synthase small subunit
MPVPESLPSDPITAEMNHWVFRVGVADRAGALTSIASAFSNRGISLETIVGHGTPYPGAPGGAVVATFWCTEAEKDAIVRIVSRLSKVTHLQECPYESSLLRKSALVQVTRRLRPQDVAGQESFLTCELVEHTSEAFTYFLAGPPSELDPVLTRAAQAGILLHTVYSVIGQ